MKATGLRFLQSDKSKHKPDRLPAVTGVFRSRIIPRRREADLTWLRIREECLAFNDSELYELGRPNKMKKIAHNAHLTLVH